MNAQHVVKMLLEADWNARRFISMVARPHILKSHEQNDGQKVQPTPGTRPLKYPMRNSGEEEVAQEAIDFLLSPSNNVYELKNGKFYTFWSTSDEDEDIDYRVVYELRDFGPEAEQKITATVGHYLDTHI